ARVAHLEAPAPKFVAGDGHRGSAAPDEQTGRGTLSLSDAHAVLVDPLASERKLDRGAHVLAVPKPRAQRRAGDAGLGLDSGGDDRHPIHRRLERARTRTTEVGEPPAPALLRFPDDESAMDDAGALGALESPPSA